MRRILPAAVDMTVSQSSDEITCTLGRLSSWQQASYQSEDQVIKSRGGQQEEQDGEEQSSNEELQQAERQSVSGKIWEPVAGLYLVQVVGAGVHSLPQDVPLLPSEEPPEGREAVDL